MTPFDDVPLNFDIFDYAIFSCLPNGNLSAYRFFAHRAARRASAMANTRGRQIRHQLAQPDDTIDFAIRGIGAAG